MNRMLTLILIIAGIVLIVQVARFLKEQDPLDLFTGAFSLLVIFGLYRITNYLRDKDG